MYATKTMISKIFGVAPPTVYRRVDGIEKEIGKRYNQYAILDKLVSVEVYADYEKYHKRLSDKNLSKTVPDFDMHAAGAYIEEISEAKKDVSEKRKAHAEDKRNEKEIERMETAEQAPQTA